MEKQINAALIVNTHSRSGEKLFFRAMDGLDARGIRVGVSHPVRDPKRLRNFVRDEIDRGYKLIIVGGGDGTISSVIDYFVDKDVTLGVLPLGTGNSFARTLGIPISLAAALDVIAFGKPAAVDVGEVGPLFEEASKGHNHFSNTVTIGFSADLVRNTTRRLKRFFGIFGYGIASIWQFLTHSYFDCELVTDGIKKVFKTHQIIIANGSYYGTSKILPDTRIDNKKLLIFMMDSMDRWQIVKFWIALFTNGRIKFPEVKYLQASQVSIKTDPPKWIDVDGEFSQKTPATIKIHPDALQVMVPRSFIDTD